MYYVYLDLYGAANITTSFPDQYLHVVTADSYDEAEQRAFELEYIHSEML